MKIGLTFDFAVVRRLLLPNLAFWMGLAAITLISNSADAMRSQREFDLAATSLAMAAGYFPWAVFTPMLTALFLQPGRLRPLFMAGVSLALYPVLMPFYVFFDANVFRWANGGEPVGFFDALSGMPAFFLLFDSLLYLMACGIAVATAAFFQVRDARRREAELELRMGELRLQALQAQLEPHFLFNALNAIGALIRTASAECAMDAIHYLSELLRYAVAVSSEKLVPLDRELELVNSYVALQKLRFEEKLQFELTDSADADCLLPPFLIQACLENAVRHGPETTGQTTQVRLELASNPRELSIRISNQPFGPGNGDSLGTGMRNLSERLALIYAGTASIEAGARSDAWVVSITLPRGVGE